MRWYTIKTCDTIPIHPSPPWGADVTYPSHNIHPSPPWGADATYPSHNTHPPKSPITHPPRVHHEVLMTCSRTHHTIPIHQSPPWGADDTYPSHSTHPLLSIMWCCTQNTNTQPNMVWWWHAQNYDNHYPLHHEAPDVMCAYKTMYCKISENNARDLYFQ